MDILLIQINEDSTKLFLAPASEVDEEELGTLRSADENGWNDDTTDLVKSKFREVTSPVRGCQISAVYSSLTF